MSPSLHSKRGQVCKRHPKAKTHIVLATNNRRTQAFSICQVRVSRSKSAFFSFFSFSVLLLHPTSCLLCLFFIASATLAGLHRLLKRLCRARLQGPPNKRSKTCQNKCQIACQNTSHTPCQNICQTKCKI